MGKADTSPIFKDSYSTLKSNFKPSSVLASTSKAIKRILQGQMSIVSKLNLRIHCVVSGKDIALCMP